MKAKLLAEIQPGQIRKGIVKNIADFGAFVDLGGIDGLLHITDMSWGRVTNPHDMVQDRPGTRGLHPQCRSTRRKRSRSASSRRRPARGRTSRRSTRSTASTRGEVVNIMSYGAFVKLEPGIEGLVHISEMSWTKRINHPSELVQIGDKIDVQVLNINHDKQEISLGMKQVQPNPWDQVAERYPPGTKVSGTVRNLTNYGAFIEIEEGIDGLLHVSDM